MSHSVQILTDKKRKVVIKSDTDKMNIAVLSFLAECLDSLIDTVEYFTTIQKAYFESDNEEVYNLLNGVANWLLPTGYDYVFASEFDYWVLYIEEE